MWSFSLRVDYEFFLLAGLGIFSLSWAFGYFLLVGNASRFFLLVGLSPSLRPLVGSGGVL